MHILCRLFGHIPADEYLGPNDQYFRAKGKHVDGIGREHWDLMAGCRWCGACYRVGRIHGPL